MTIALHYPDDTDAPPHQRLWTISAQLDGMLNAGEFAGAPEASRRAVADLVRAIFEIGNTVAPNRRAWPRTSSLIEAIRDARTDGQLADVWRGSGPRRLNMSAADQCLVIMAWIDAATRLSMDDGR